MNHPKKLRAQQVVGVIAADDVTLEILPKIDGNESDAAARRSLVHMLAAVLDLDIVEGSLTDLGWQRDYLLEIVIRLFCDRLFEAFHRGLPRRYVPHEDDLAALRGRLDVKRQFTVLAASPQRLACRYDELSADIALNQIMKAAVTKLAKVARAPENQRRLAELSFAFADITALPAKALLWHQVDDPTYGVGQADVYQMMAYAHVYRCERLLLLYPHHAGVGSEPAGLTCVHRINGTDDSRIGVATLSLSNPRGPSGS